MKTLHNLHRLKRVSKFKLPSLLLSKVSQSARSLMERAFYKPRFDENHSPQSETFRFTPLRLIHKHVLQPGFSEKFRTLFPNDYKTLIKEADRSLDLIFDLLGSGAVDLKEFRERKDLVLIGSNKKSMPGTAPVRGRIPWHFDFKSGRGWDPACFYKDIPFFIGKGCDVKIPWELSRCQHLVRLGQAYRLTHDEKYTKAFVNHVEDWIQQNPVKYGVNWANPMEIALRASQWLLALELFTDSDELSSSFLSRLGKSLREHGHHIYHHLEYAADVSTNHYLSNFAGLYYLGVGLGVNKWKLYSRNKLRKEIILQTYDDGMDYEASTGYHRYVSELFVYFTVVCVRQMNQDKEISWKSVVEVLGRSYGDRLRLVVEQTSNLLDSNGIAPQVGDNDSGHFHSFINRDDLNFKPFLELCSFLSRESEGERSVSHKFSEKVWIWGFSEEPRGRIRNKNKDKNHHPSGIFQLRGGDDALFFLAQPNGTNGVGNHTHNDKLSFTLTKGGLEFFTDPGTGVYTSDAHLRNQLRSTRMHNTVEVDGEEQNRFISGSLFTLANDARIKIHAWIPGKMVEAQHEGYQRLNDPVVHLRRIERISSPLQWVITDDMKGKGQHRLKWTYILSPKVDVKVINPQKVQLRVGNKGLDLIWEGKRGEIVVEEGPYSPRYGVVQSTKLLRISVVASLPFSGRTLLLWQGNSDE